MTISNAVGDVARTDDRFDDLSIAVLRHFQSTATPTGVSVPLFSVDAGDLNEIYHVERWD